MKNEHKKMQDAVKGNDVLFANGADLSLLKRNMDNGYSYKVNGEIVDPIKAFKDSGFNYARLRLFHTPSMDGAQVNSLPYTCALAKQLVKAGFKILLNIHYSDTWADPSKQITPKEWQGLSFGELEKSVYEYTLNSVRALIEAGAEPEMVQVGNEITPGFLWESGRVADAHNANIFHWTRKASSNNAESWCLFGKLLKAGICGVRDATGEATSIMIHIDRGGDMETSQWFFDNLSKQEVPYDAIGQSYYPFWHGMPENLCETLNDLVVRYEKDIYVVETGYPWKYHEMYKTVLNGSQEAWENFTAKYSLSPDGQLSFLQEVTRIVKEIVHRRGKGVFYWAPEWIRPQEVGLVDEGDAEPCWARALFDDDGNALPAFNIFNTVHKTQKARKITSVKEFNSPGVKTGFKQTVNTEITRK